MKKMLVPLLLVLAASCVGVPSANPPEVALEYTPLPLNASDPSQQRIGALRYLGGLHLTSRDHRFGGLSALRWKDGRLFSVIDEGGWASFEPVEQGDRLTGARALELGPLREEGGPALDKESGDAESLTRDGGDWLVGFERRHRILRFRSLNQPGRPSGIDPKSAFGALGHNEGVEAMAGNASRLFFCAERLPGKTANCAIREGASITPATVAPPPELDPEVAFPTDADFGSDGTVYILFRSWSGGKDNRGAIVARSPHGALATLAVFVAPTSVDNFEGLAVREHEGRTFLYVISDDNFSSRDKPESPADWQRTLLMKFERID